MVCPDRPLFLGGEKGWLWYALTPCRWTMKRLSSSGAMSWTQVERPLEEGSR